MAAIAMFKSVERHSVMHTYIMSMPLDRQRTDKIKTLLTSDHERPLR